jgi:hypothetical protein
MLSAFSTTVHREPCPRLAAREPGWYLDGELIGSTLYCPTDEELAAGAELDLDEAPL